MHESASSWITYNDCISHVEYPLSMRCVDSASQLHYETGELKGAKCGSLGSHYYELWRYWQFQYYVA